MFQSLALAASGLIPAPAFSLGREILVGGPRIPAVVPMAVPAYLTILAEPGYLIQLVNKWDYYRGGVPAWMMTSVYYIAADHKHWFKVNGDYVLRKDYPLLETALGRDHRTSLFTLNEKFIKLPDFTIRAGESLNIKTVPKYAIGNAQY